MREKPICAVNECNNPALVLFGNKWICGNCLIAYDTSIKEKQFNDLQEVLKCQ